MKVECPHCHAKVGTSRLHRITLACYPPIHQTFCPVCDKLIEEVHEGDDGSYDIDLSECTAEQENKNRFLPATSTLKKLDFSKDLVI